MLITLPSASELDDYSGSATQVSQPVALAAGQAILLESAHWNGRGPGLQQVSSKMSLADGRCSHMARGAYEG